MTIQNNLAAGLLSLYQLESNATIHDEAIRTLKNVVERGDSSDPHYSRYLASYAGALSQRAAYQNDSDDRCAAISAYDQALEYVPAESQLRAQIMAFKGLQEFFQYEFSKNESELRAALGSLRRATDLASTISPPTTLDNAASWANVAFLMERWSEVIEAYQYAESVIEELVHGQLFRNQSETLLANTQGLAAKTAVAYAHLDDPINAALVLERGQARLLTRSMSLENADLEILRARGQDDLCERYEVAVDRRRTLERQEHTTVIDPSLRRSTTKELRNIITEIRKIAGLEHFMSVLDEAGLAQAAAISPLLYLAATHSGGIGVFVYLQHGELASQAVRLDWLSSEAVETALNKQGGFHNSYSNWLAKRDHSSTIAWMKSLSNTCEWLWEYCFAWIDELISSVDQLTIIPVGQLAYFPWHAAFGVAKVNGYAEKYLLEKINVSYSLSASVLIQSNGLAQRTPASRLMVIETPPSENDPLDFSTFEVDVVAAKFPADNVMRIDGEKATLSRVLIGLADANVFHFTGHGASDLENPLQSRLQLLGDEALTLADIMRERAEGLRLTVLSACETGIVGSKLPNEFINLASGFVLARSAGVVASLWSVDDISTALLMAAFYHHWRDREKSPAVALNRAQRWLRQSTNKEIAEFVKPLPGAKKIETQLRLLADSERSFAHPYFWSGFVFVGV